MKEGNTILTIQAGTIRYINKSPATFSKVFLPSFKRVLLDWGYSSEGESSQHAHALGPAVSITKLTCLSALLLEEHTW